MTKNYYSIRKLPPSECAPEYYRTIDVGRPKGLLMTACILKKHEHRLRGFEPRARDWRNYGATQRYLIPKENVEPCGNTLCPLNRRGKRELKSLQKCGPIKRRRGTCKKIVKSDLPDPDLYQIVNADEVQ